MLGGLAVCGLCGAGWGLSLVLFVRPTPFVPRGGADARLNGPLLPWDEHDRIYARASEPLVLRLKAASGSGGVGAGELLYIGVRHTQDAAEPVLAEIERLWGEFRPTVALCEGRTRRFVWMPRAETGRFTESDLVFVMARRSGIDCLSLEPTGEAEAGALVESFPRDTVAAFLTLRGVFSESRGTSDDPDGLAMELLEKRAGMGELRGAVTGIADLDRVWAREAGATGAEGGADWRTLSDFPKGTGFDAVANASREFRGVHMMRTLVELSRRGERVLAVVGKSHVIRQEGILRRAMDGERVPETPKSGG